MKDNIIKFTPKPIKDEKRVIARVFLSDDKVAMDMGGTTTLLKPRLAFDLAMLLLSAIRAKADAAYRGGK